MAKRPPSEVLADFDRLPDSVLVEDSVAADVLGTSRGALAVWRHLRKGPDFVRVGDRVRYSVGSLRKVVVDGTVKCEPTFAQDSNGRRLSTADLEELERLRAGTDDERMRRDPITPLK